MLIKVSGKGDNRQAPNDLSDYVRTYNHAIDLVTQAVGWAEKVSTRQVAAIALRPLMYRNFCEGVKLLLKQHGASADIDPATQMEWHGYKVIEGSRAQTESVIIQFVENKVNPKLYS